MDLELKNRLAFVSGSSAGIGFATARALAREGAEVVINGRNARRLEDAVKRLRDELPGARISGVAADLATAEGVKKVTRTIPHVDVLVNNLGIYAAGDVTRVADSEWLRFFETNVLSGVRLAREWLDSMKQNNWGRIVFISSGLAINLPIDMTHYGVTKVAQLAVVRGLTEAVAGTGITVNSVLPGLTATEGVQDFVGALLEENGGTVEELQAAVFGTDRPTSLLRRFIEPDEIGHLVAYLASPLAAAINGAAIPVNGGAVHRPIAA
ncbi:MAG TPA: SDR family NAD(P)-dependent oxidoreductase [Wenzhouxiangella sp.]|nr:SDR family NAD(P)-dependent oxidoreductase [Wenzhouxiangella sp.]